MLKFLRINCIGRQIWIASDKTMMTKDVWCDRHLSHTIERSGMRRDRLPRPGKDRDSGQLGPTARRIHLPVNIYRGRQYEDDKGCLK